MSTVNPSGTGDNTADILGDFHDKRILEVLEDNTVYYDLADKRPLAMRNGNTITFHTMDQATDGVILTEGSPPDMTFMTAGTKTATLLQFGARTGISDMLEDTAIVSMIEQAIVRYGKSAARTVDKYIQDRLFSEVSFDADGTTYYHEGPLGTVSNKSTITTWYDGVHAGLSAFFLSTDKATKITAGQVSTYFTTDCQNSTLESETGPQGKINLAKVRTIINKLEEDNVSPFENGYYALVQSPTSVKALREDPEWQKWNRYNDAEKFFKNEVGEIEGCKVIKCTNQLKFNCGLQNNVTAYNNVFLGSQAFAVTELSGKTGIKSFTLGFDHKDSDNVLQQRAIVGYKWTGVAKVLDSDQGYGLLSFDANNSSLS